MTHRSNSRSTLPANVGSPLMTSRTPRAGSRHQSPPGTARQTSLERSVRFSDAGVLSAASCMNGTPPSSSVPMPLVQAARESSPATSPVTIMRQTSVMLSPSCMRPASPQIVTARASWAPRQYVARPRDAEPEAVQPAAFAYVGTTRPAPTPREGAAAGDIARQKSAVFNGGLTGMRASSPALPTRTPPFQHHPAAVSPRKHAVLAHCHILTSPRGSSPPTRTATNVALGARQRHAGSSPLLGFSTN